MSDNVTTFFASWSMTDRDARRDVMAGVFDTTFSYADPRTPDPITNLDALADYIGMFIDAAPGATAGVAKSDAQHGLTRATILFRMANGMEQAGQYFITHNDDGLITQMTGFVGTGATE